MAGGGREKAIPCDNVIVAGEVHSARDLAEELAAAGLPVQAIGDATGLGLIVKATRTAAEAVAAL
jgi:hypothetical protein